MSAITWSAQHRFWVLGIGVAVILVAVAAGLWFFVLRSPATQLDLGQALRLYRQSQNPGPDGAASRLAPSGVYQYRTSGSEHLSFGGISRSFPAETDMIVTEARCTTMKWEPIEQHIEGLVECPQEDGALNITSVLSYEQIAGTQTTSVIHCPTDTYFVPSHPSVGERWRTTCHSPGQKVILAGHVIGAASVEVGGRMVAALHTRLTLSFSGSEKGTNPNDYWVSLPVGLILRQRERVDVSQRAGPLGSVRYTENMAITLSSVTPIR